MTLRRSDQAKACRRLVAALASSAITFALTNLASANPGMGGMSPAPAPAPAPKTEQHHHDNKGSGGSCGSCGGGGGSSGLDPRLKSASGEAGSRAEGAGNDGSLNFTTGGSRRSESLDGGALDSLGKSIEQEEREALAKSKADYEQFEKAMEALRQAKARQDEPNFIDQMDKLHEAAAKDAREIENAERILGPNARKALRDSEDDQKFNEQILKMPIPLKPDNSGSSTSPPSSGFATSGPAGPPRTDQVSATAASQRDERGTSLDMLTAINVATNKEAGRSAMVPTDQHDINIIMAQAQHSLQGSTGTATPATQTNSSPIDNPTPPGRSPSQSIISPPPSGDAPPFGAATPPGRLSIPPPDAQQAAASQMADAQMQRDAQAAASKMVDDYLKKDAQAQSKAGEMAENFANTNSVAPDSAETPVGPEPPSSGRSEVPAAEPALPAVASPAAPPPDEFDEMNKNAWNGQRQQ